MSTTDSIVTVNPKKVGETYGEWTILKKEGRHSYCQCSCGTTKLVETGTLGKTSLSCGHLKYKSLNVSPDMKVCNNCDKTLPLENFHKDKGSGRGVRPKCKDCVRLYDSKVSGIRTKKAREKYRSNPKEKIIKTSAYRKLHPEYGVLGGRLTMGGGKLVGDATPTNLQEKLINEFNNKCYICDVSFENALMHWDHYQPIAKGGDHSLKNLRPACKECNIRKNATWPLTNDLLNKIAADVRALRTQQEHTIPVTDGLEV